MFPGEQEKLPQANETPFEKRVQSGKWQVVAPRAGALFREGIQPDKGPPKLRGAGAPTRECVACTGRSHRPVCLWRVQRGRAGLLRAWRRGHVEGWRELPGALGVSLTRNPPGTQFLNGGIYYKDIRKAHSRQTLKAGMWADWRKELTGVCPGKPSYPFCSLLAKCPLQFSLFLSPAPRPRQLSLPPVSAADRGRPLSRESVFWF